MYPKGKNKQEVRPMEKEEETNAKLKKLARKAHNARQRRQYDIVRLYLQGRKKLK